MVGMLLDNPGRYRTLRIVPLDRPGRTGVECDIAAIERDHDRGNDTKVRVTRSLRVGAIR